MDVRFHKYGRAPYGLVLLHGGPGAGGELAAVAEELSGETGVIEALQEGLSVADTVTETIEILLKHTDTPTVLAGHSWGAWLGVMVAEKQPGLVKRLVLISSGPFDQVHARKIMPARMERLGLDDKNRLSELFRHLKEDSPDRDRVFGEIAGILAKADTFRERRGLPVKALPNYLQYQAVWPTAARLRDCGKLLELASRLECPVVAIHGDYDPHPAEGVSKPLSNILRNFDFIRLDHCGHYPWKEEEAHERFFESLVRYL